jgi:hypothetical protein
MNRARVPFIVVVVALLVGALTVERDRATTATEAASLELFRAAPLAAGADVLGAVWFCAAGSSDADGPADHTVVVTNPTEVDHTVELTAFPGQADPVTRDVTVPARSLERVRLADLVEAPAVAATVEIAAGELSVTHELQGPNGRDVGPCASTTSQEWHFAWGDTSRDARSRIALFNPFPGDAVVDFEFVTIDGSRAPNALTGVVVPGRSVVVADVDAEIARRDHVSATATARAGRIVAERIQVFDDTEEMLLGAEPRRALTVDLGSPVPMTTWVFPSIRLAEGLTERVVVYNPGGSSAEVDVEILVADNVLGGVEPFELTVRANSYEIIDLTSEARLTALLDDGPVEATMIVRSLNDVGVVAERVTTVPTSAEGPGITASTGMPLAGRILTVVDPRPSSSEGSSLTLVNPDGTALVTGSITVVSRGTQRPLAGFATFELAPAGRVTIDLADRVSGAGTSILVIESSHPVAAGVVARSIDPNDRLAIEAIARADDARPPA